MGESASLGYLQVLRHSIATTVGDCLFTTDASTHQMVEQETPCHLGSISSEPSVSLDVALPLVAHFELSASGVLDLFDTACIQQRMADWIADPKRKNTIDSSIMYLIIAIGALASDADLPDGESAERYFHFGRQQALLQLLDDPCLETVQVFTLITYYMIISCRCNGAFTNLGIAARTAYALGIHRHETNSAFAREVGISRERAWKSLRVCDLYLSSSLGRPPATSEAVCSIPWSDMEMICENGEFSVQYQVASAIFRVCLIFERILVEVYSRRSMTLCLATSISNQHREWSIALATMLKVDRLVKTETSMARSAQKLGVHIVTLAFYYSVIQLSRPFLVHLVCASSWPEDWLADAPRRDVALYADACVDAAIKSIHLASNIVYDASMPKRQPLIINNVFISAICLGHAFLGDYDQKAWPLSVSLDAAIDMLQELSAKNPQAARYAEICRHMRDAVGLYLCKRAKTALKDTEEQVKNVFGDVQPHLLDDSADEEEANAHQEQAQANQGDGLFLFSSSGLDYAVDEFYDMPLSMDDLLGAASDGCWALGGGASESCIGA